MPHNLNLIYVNADTFRRDHLGCYGNPWIKTPNLDRFAQNAIVFDNAYSGSFPTVPNRHEVLTGRYVFTYHDWAPLPSGDTVLAEVLGRAGYTTMMVDDTPHILQRGFGYDRGFTAFNWIRGQENDRLYTDPSEVVFSCARHKVRNPELIAYHLRSVARRQQESDCFCARTMSAAAEWLERNHRQRPFFLYVDTFDPHEPWDPPSWYTDRYDPGYSGEVVTYPRYGFWEEYLSEPELRHCHAMYSGECSLVDTWVGRLLATIERLGLLEDTAVFFTTDHGFYFGEHGIIGKVIIPPGGGMVPYPLHEEVVRIPLIAHIPGFAGGQRVEAFVQPVDVMPTFLDLAGAADPGTTHGHSILPLLQGEKAKLREFAVSSYSIASPSSVGTSTVTTAEWAFTYGAPDATGQGVRTEAVDSTSRDELAWEVARTPALYHRPTDPAHERNVIAAHPEVARALHAEYLSFLESIGTTPERLAPRRELRLPG